MKRPLRNDLLKYISSLLSYLRYYHVPDIVCAIIYNVCNFIFWNIPPRLGGEIIFTYPSQDLWIARQKDFKIFIPNPAEAHRIKGLVERGTLKRYTTYESHVSVDHGDIVVDVGASFGGFTIPAASQAKKVIAIEPDPQSYRCLNKNISHLRNVICIPKAAWNRKELRELKLGVKHADSSLINVDGKSIGKSVNVQADRLDDIINSELGINKIDFLKIDAEGAEPEVLAGAENLLKVTKKVACDCTPERFGKSTSLICSEILRQAGFQVHISQNMIVFAWKSQQRVTE